MLADYKHVIKLRADDSHHVITAATVDVYRSINVVLDIVVTSSAINTGAGLARVVTRQRKSTNDKTVIPILAVQLQVSLVRVNRKAVITTGTVYFGFIANTAAQISSSGQNRSDLVTSGYSSISISGRAEHLTDLEAIITFSAIYVG